VSFETPSCTLRQPVRRRYGLGGFLPGNARIFFALVIDRRRHSSITSLPGSHFFFKCAAISLAPASRILGMDIISLCCTRALVYDAIFCGHEMRLVRRDCSCLLCQSDLGSSATIEYFGPFPLSETVVLPPVNVFMMCRRHALPLASWKATHILVLIDLMPTKEN